MIKGKASIEGTTQLEKKFLSLVFQSLGETGLKTTQAGFGTYRIDHHVQSHDDALAFALEMGINLIDTSSNYADGRSEELIGKVVEEGVQSGKLSRDSLIIVSKGGYIQGQNWELAIQREKDGNPFPDLVGISEGLAHCIHPEFLKDQIDRSLQRLNMETIDIYLLHNPEYYLESVKDKKDIEEARDEYYRRLGEAFLYLETEVKNGRIQYYGISSNTFPSSSQDPKFTSLDHVLKTAENVDTNHHLRVIQFPCNLIEKSAIVEANQTGEKTLLELASNHHLGVLVNRPLNAIENSKLIRLSDYNTEDIVDETMILEVINALKEMENELKQNLIENMTFENDQDKLALEDIFSIGKNLNDQWKSFQSYVHWKDVLGQLFIPSLEFGLHLLAQGHDEDMLESWASQYIQRFNTLSQQISLYYQGQDQEQISAIKHSVEQSCSMWGKATNLSSMAVRALRSTEGISCVLVGMRECHYVEDILSELSKKSEIKAYKKEWKKLNVGSVVR